MSDAKAKAANDTPTAEPTASSSPSFTHTQIVPVAIVILDFLAGDGPSQIIDMTKPPQVVADIQPPELVIAAVEHLKEAGAVATTRSLVSMTTKGWRYLMIAKDELSKIEMGKLEDELRAHKDRVAEEHRLVQLVRSRESSVEAAKSGVTAAKERLEEALTQMTTFLSGAVQTTLKQAQEVTGNMTAYEQGFSAFSRGQTLDRCTYEVESDQWLEWRRGWRLARMATVEERDAKKLKLKADDLSGFLLEDGALTVGEKAPKITDIVVNCLEHDWLVIDAVDTKPGAVPCPVKFLLLPIFSIDEWQQLCEKDFGRAVDGFDQNNEAKARRTAGGPDCGRIVKVGRKKGVVAPMKNAIAVLADVEA